MNKYSPYWILDPIKNNMTVNNHKNWSFYTTQEVIEGKSPLNNLGQNFYDIAHSTKSIYDHCLWIFNDLEFEIQNCSKFSRILKSVSEAGFNSFLSKTGYIIKHENDTKTKQPPLFDFYEYRQAENITDEKLIRVLDITQSIYENDLKEYWHIFEYLREIKNSSGIIREIALWSFVEQHWKLKPEDKFEFCLGHFGRKLYSNKEENKIKDPKYHKLIKLLVKFSEIGLGNKSNNTAVVRNSLAHGRVFIKSRNWKEKEWELFKNIHELLEEMVILCLKKEIDQMGI